MKSLQLSIILIVGIMVVPSIQNAISMPNLSPQDLYKQSDMVFYGQVISKQTGPNLDYYQIKVQTYFKNPQTTDSITAAGHKPEGGHITYPQFEIGDKAIFYISKIDGINTISPWSQIAGDACDAHSFLGPEYFGTLGNYHGGPASNTRLLDVNGDALERILINQEVVLRYDAVWNNYPESRTIPVSVSIQNEDNGQQIFNKTQNLQVQACSFAGDLKWNFTPTQIGNYVVKIDVDNKTEMTYGFSVIFDSTSSKIIMSPLKQFKSGIASKDVKCADGLTLVIKSEDGSPACVKPDTAQILTERGWTTSTSPSNNMTGTKTNDPFGITALIIYHPPDVCLNLVPPSNNVTVHGCPPNTFYLKINSVTTAYLMGYNICDGDSCTKTNDMSALLPIKDILTPNFQMFGLPVDLKWRYGDTVEIQLYVSSTSDNKTASLVDLGNSTIVP